jgi:hypothetical protein
MGTGIRQRQQSCKRASGRVVAEEAPHPFAPSSSGPRRSQPPFGLSPPKLHTIGLQLRHAQPRRSSRATRPFDKLRANGFRGAEAVTGTSREPYENS